MLRRVPACVSVFALCLATAAGQAPDKQAEQLLSTAQKAFNEGNPRAAADQFGEFLKKHPGQTGTNAAKYGLGLALLDLPERDYQKALEAFTGPAGEGKFKDQPPAIYYLAVCNRGLALKELEAGAKAPAEADRRRDAAAPKLTEAARLFGRAAEEFGKRKADGDAEWAARSRCDAAEMDLRLNKPKDARAAVEPFVKDAALAKSKSRPLGLYYHGFACFRLNDIPAAGKSLGLVAPFDQPFGPHARYLLGRVHQAGGENAEAAAAFDAVIAGHEKQKKEAVELLKQPDRFKNDPWEKSRLESLVKDPPPDYVAGAAFHGACLNYEAGKFGEALPKFQAFAKDFAQSPFAADALLRAGYCLVQLRQYDEAAKVLRPLADSQPRLADQALYWLGKAQLAQALAIDASNKPARQQASQAALATLRTAADKAAQLAAKDPAANERRVEILLEVADAMLAGGQEREAADAYLNSWKAHPTGDRADDVLARVVAAQQLARDWTNAIYHAGIFKQKYPRSPLLPEVLFREAEALHDKAANSLAKKDGLVKEYYPKAVAAYESLVAKYPEFERVGRAKYGLAICHAELGDWEKCAAVLETIPGPDRVGDAAAASYLLADCLIRTAPAKADDALADNMLREKLGNAITLLEGFVAGSPKGAEAPDALLKVGYCYKRLGVQLAEPKEKNEAFAKARAAFDKLQKEYANSDVLGEALLERAKVRALQGDKGGAAGELRAFTQDPLARSPVAALAVVAYATLLREQNQAPAAAAALKEARQKYEATLNADPAKAEWAHLLRLHLGIAELESGKFTEARKTLEDLIGIVWNRPLGVEAALKLGQAQAQEQFKLFEQAVKDKQAAAGNMEKAAEAERRVQAARYELKSAAHKLQERANTSRTFQTPPEGRARLCYEAAWIYRQLVPFAPINPHGRPMTEAERDGKDAPSKEMIDLMRAAYSRVIGEFGDVSTAVDARFELAEIESDLGNADLAVKLLKEALEKEPTDRPTPPETAERIRLRLGAALFDQKQYDTARGQFEAIAQNPKSPWRGQAQYRLAECLFAAGKAEEAKNALKPFRDDAAFQHVSGVSDRAMLRLGHAYGAVKNWESSRQVLETMIARYANSPWTAEARYGIGWALENQARYDDAVSQFSQVTSLKADELAGKAHLQIGLCRAAQKKYGEAVKAFTTVAYGYDAPELRFAALLEAARALDEDKKPDEAVKLLEKVVKDAPADSEWSKAAKERLAKGKK